MWAGCKLTVLQGYRYAMGNWLDADLTFLLHREERMWYELVQQQFPQLMFQFFLDSTPPEISQCLRAGSDCQMLLHCESILKLRF